MIGSTNHVILVCSDCACDVVYISENATLCVVCGSTNATVTQVKIISSLDDPEDD